MAKNALLKLHLKVEKLSHSITQAMPTYDIDSASVITTQQLQITEHLLLHKRLYFKFLELQLDPAHSRTDLVYFKAMENVFRNLQPQINKMRKLLHDSLANPLPTSSSNHTPIKEQQRVSPPANVDDTSAIKSSIAKNHWAILRSHLHEGNHRHIAFSRRLQVASEYINNILNNLERSLLQRAGNHCENHYQAIVRRHQSNVAWLDFLIEIYQNSYDNVDAIIKEIDEKGVARKKLFKDLALGVISVALSPIGMDKLLAPLLTLASSMPLERMVEKFNDDYAIDLIENACDSALESKDGQHATVKQVMGDVDPLKILQLARMYCQHKLQGVLANAHQLFNPEIDHNILLGEVGAQQLVHDLIARKIREIKARLTRVDWEIYCESDFRKFREKLLTEAEQELIELIDQCFALLSRQYQGTAETANFSKLIEQLTFDDSATGHNAVRQQWREDLQQQLQHIVETTMLMQVGSDTRTFFGKIKPVGCCSMSDPSYYAQYPSFKSLELLQQIKQRHQLLFPNDTETEKLLEREPGKLLLNKLGHDAFASQVYRQKLLNKLFAVYDPKDLESKIKETISTFAKDRGFVVEVNKKSATGDASSTAASGWVAEATLTKSCRSVFSDLIAFSQERKLLQEQEYSVLREIASLDKLRRELLGMGLRHVGQKIPSRAQHSSPFFKSGA